MGYLTSQQAAAALGVTKATLYAYTSRGQVRSEPVPGQPRERRYHRADIERLRERKESRRDPARAAARSLDWGNPVLDSGITLIQNGRLYYRGHDALKLAETATLEQAATLLWGAELIHRAPALSPDQLAHLRKCAPDPFSLIQAALPLSEPTDIESYDLRPAAVCNTGARILRLLAMLATRRDTKAPVHFVLQKAWAPNNNHAGEAIRTALVLCADHELNVSTFAARCAASAGATPYGVVSAALATLKGGRHGGATERVSALFKDAAAANPRTAITNRLRQGERVPGFGHPLYPEGDPRARLLLAAVPVDRMDRNLIKAGAELLHDHPNLDFALVTLARAYRLPAGAPLLLFALGRTVGWIAHAIEQYSSGRLIRPRARYVGPVPEAEPR